MMILRGTMPGAGRWGFTPLRCAYAALALLACVVYVPYLHNPMVFDEVGNVSPLATMDTVFRFDITNVMRWLPTATLAHTWLLTDGNIVALRLGNLILHILTAMAVCKLVRELYLLAVAGDMPATQAREGEALLAALVAAVIFTLHPLSIYAAGYLAQRSIVMSTLFMVLMLLAFTRWLVSGRRSLWVWSALCYLLSVFCKEHSVMAPAAALLLALALRRQSRVGCADLIAPFLVFASITALIVVIRNLGGLLGATYEVSAGEMLSGAGNAQLEALMAQGAIYKISVLTQMGLFFKYLMLWFVPDPQWMAADMRVAFAPSLWAWPYWVGGAAFLLYPLLMLALIWRGGRMALAAWAMTVPWVLFATELSTARIQEPFVLYRTYLWFAFCGMVPALWFARWWAAVGTGGSSGRAAVRAGAAVLLLACLLVPLSWNRLHTFSDPLLLWEDAAKLLASGDEVGAGRIYYNRGLYRAQAGRKVEALEDLNRTVALHPRLTPVLEMRAHVLYDLARYTEALADIDASIAVDPKRAGIYGIRAAVLRRLGRLDEARDDYRKACKMGEQGACVAAERMATPLPH